MRKTISLGLAASLAACVHSSDAPTRQVDQAQAEASTELAHAHDAQENARKKAEQAQQAEDNAQRKQREAEVAQRRAVQAREDADEAQRQALIVGRESGQRAQAAQERAIREQPNARAQALRQGTIESTRGTVESVANDELIIRRASGLALHLRIDASQTAITRDGKPVQTDAIDRGQTVIVSYRMEGDQPVAQMVELGAVQQSLNAPR